MAVHFESSIPTLNKKYHDENFELSAGIHDIDSNSLENIHHRKDSIISHVSNNSE